MRNLLIITFSGTSCTSSSSSSSSSCILTSYTTKHPIPIPLSLHHNPTTTTLLHSLTKLTPLSALPSPSPPLTTTPHTPPPDDHDHDHATPAASLSYFAKSASELVKDGRFEDFEMVMESLMSQSGGESHEIVLKFGEMLDLELVREGIVKGLQEGKILSVVVWVLSWFPKLGVDVLGLFDGFGLSLVKDEFVKIVYSGFVEDAIQVMEALAGFQFQIKEMIKPNDMIRVSVQRRSPDLAVRYACFLPYSENFICKVIEEFGKRSDLVSALKVFEASKQMMSGHSMFVYRTIIDVCGLCGKFFKARFIYEELLVQKVTPNIYIFNSIMNVNAHDLAYITQVYHQLQDLGVPEDMTSYNILLKACCRAGNVDLAEELYGKVRRLELAGALKMDVFTYSTMIKVFADAKLWQKAFKIKDDMLSAGVCPNVVTWSSLIKACCEAGLVDQAVLLFDEMLMSGCEPNSQCFNTLLHTCVAAHQFDRAFRLFNSWKSSGSPGNPSDQSSGILRTTLSAKTREDESSISTEFRATTSHHSGYTRCIPFKPTIVTYNILLKACGSDLHRATSLFAEMKMMGLSPNEISWSTMIDICGRAGNVRRALQILTSMRESGNKPNVVAYSTAIKVCVDNNYLKIAFSLFNEMKKDRVKPNLVTYNSLLRAHSRYGSLPEVQRCLEIYQEKRKAGYKSNDYYLKSLIDQWCEGVLQEKDHQEGQSPSHNRDYIRGLRTLMLERVATFLQNNMTEGLGVDIQGLTKVEARLFVLAVLRMIKENYKSGCWIRDDLLIILGTTQAGAFYEVKDAIVKLLEKELGLEVVDKYRNRKSTPDTSSGSTEDTEFDGPNRRPVVMQRLLVTKTSLEKWLQKRVGTAAKG